ncbi:MAG: A/G-specific adenine glycosylase [Planctomycetes bacterium]|nr:A/G-specific adenine glycosylase [Planctomycetota bacterium]
MAATTRSFAGRLLRWFDTNRRDLPWRRTRDPWSIWVSEVMLQQTRVEAVRAAYERFVQRFPTPASFAAASDDELFAAWHGLGYYRRARLLREGARTIVARHGGRVPECIEELAELPGIGAYTSGAVASIAFGIPAIAVDGNVERVIARHTGIRDDIATAAAKRRIVAFVGEAMDRDRAGDFNQALMELGALVCTPSSPRCGACPLAADCVALRSALVETLPVRKKPRAAVEVTARVVFAVRGDRALGTRIPADRPNAGQIELPGPGILTTVAAEDLARSLRERFAARCEVGALIATVRHAITHHRIVVHAHATTVRAPGRLQWFGLGQDTPWTTPSRKVFARVLGTGDEA